jgi:hypothetical protein
MSHHLRIRLAKTGQTYGYKKDANGGNIIDFHGISATNSIVAIVAYTLSLFY